MRAWLGLAAICAATVLVRLRLAGMPLERDEGEYAYMGQLILRGEVPYVAAVNMKLPGTYYAYAAVLAAFGETAEAVRVGLLLANLGAIVLLFLLGRRLLDAAAGLTAAATYALLSLSPTVLGLAAKAEHFVVLCVLAGLLVLPGVGARRGAGRAAVAGALLGLAVLMKQHGAAFVAFGGAWILWTGWRSGRVRATLAEAAAFTAGAALPLAATALAMWRAGAFEPFWFWTVTYAREYAVLVPLGVGLGELARQATAIVAASPALWLLVLLGATAPAWDRAVRAQAPFLAGLTLASCAAIVPGLRFSEHYFVMLLPAASLLAGAGVTALARRAGPGLASAARVGVPLAAVAATLLQARATLVAEPVALTRAIYGRNPFPEAIEVARWLAAHTAPDERVAVIGSEPEIYFLAGRRAATSYMYTYPLMESHPFAHEMQDAMIAELERARPRVLVLVNVDTSWSRTPASSLELLAWAETTVNAGYEQVGLIEIPPDGAAVSRWGAAAQGAAPRTPAFVAVFERR
ncbi:MAG: glycosyltransferase family 39 protein [bacterium]|nr:glycosyltransferase family 39 protein [bacterium]